MGLLVDGVWQDRWYDTDKTGGRFQRTLAQYRNWITPDGTPGPTGEGGFAAAPDRYYLYVSPACPWSHRAMIYRALKKLEPIIGMSVVDYHMGEQGWVFSSRDGATPDAINHAATLAEIYVKADPHYTGRVTVPALWDIERKTIVSNELSDIIRMFETAFDAFTDARIDARPPALAAEIDETQQENLRDGERRRVPHRLRHEPGSLRGRHSARCSRRSTNSTRGSRRGAICLDRSRLKPTGGCSRRSSASMRSMSDTSSATCAGSPTTRTSPATRATSTSTRASRAR